MAIKINGVVMALAMEPGVARVVDANANRAREGLRTAEDFARFVLNDGRLAAGIKAERHRLTETLKALTNGGLNLVYARDVVGDVGADRQPRCAINGKGGFREAAIAGMKRAEEAVRVIEEAFKSHGLAEAGQLAAVRYQLYELERELAIRGWPGRRLASVYLYVLVTPERCVKGVAETVEEAISGGAEMIQFRQKTWDDGKYLEEARKVFEICRRKGVAFIVNDRVDVACALGADGVHLGRGDFPVPLARRLLGPSAIIGRSTRGGDEAREAWEMGADYVAVGPVFETRTAPEKTSVGLDTLKRTVAMEIPAPIFAIGGISADNVEAVMEAGGTRLAICSAITGKEDVEGETRKIRGKLLKLM